MIANLDGLLATIEGFYVAASGERAWSDALDDVRHFFRASRSCIVETGGQTFGLISSEPVDDPLFSDIAGFRLYCADPIARAESAVPFGIAYAWRDIADITALKRRALWSDFYGPMGLHEALSCRLGRWDDSTFLFHVTREQGQPIFGSDDRRAFDRLLPHLRRAGALGRNLDNPWRGGVQDRSTAMFVVDGHGRVDWRNDAAEIALLGESPLCVRRGQLTCASPAEAVRLARLITGACLDEPDAGGSLVVGGRVEGGACRRYVLEISPLRGVRSFGLPAAGRAAVTVRNFEGGTLEPPRLNALFGLTGAEAALAAELAAGFSLREAAARRGITFGTARNYLLRIFHKTGTGRQADLVRLLRMLVG